MGKWRRAKSLPRRWQRNHLINKYGSICYLCTEPFARMEDITIDHIIPLGKGGPDTLENYGLAHLNCNQLKKDLSYEEFQEFQKGNIKWEE